jgi:hypothetical protein
MFNHHLRGVPWQRGHKPAKQCGSRSCADELGNDEARRIDWPDSGEGIGSGAG